MVTSPFPAQTTLLIGGSNGTATLCAILGDKSKAVNTQHTIRVATRTSRKFLDARGGPRVWRCQEKKHLSDVVSADFLPTRILTHVGAPDSVFVYGDRDASPRADVSSNNDNVNNNDKDNDNDNGNASNGGTNGRELSPLERAISGVNAPDNGGVADIIVLVCPVSAHLSLLRRVARALYNLDACGLLGASHRSPLLLGSLYAAGGFDWMSRISFYRERPPGFTRWKRPLGLFGLKAFPYLTKSLSAGDVTLHGRFPQLQVAVAPSDARTRGRARVLLDRVLQNATTGKRLEFLGLGSAEHLGGDGSIDEEIVALLRGQGTGHVDVEAANSARNAMMIAAQTHNRLKEAKVGSSSGAMVVSMSPPAMLPPATARNDAVPESPALDFLVTRSLSDDADPSSTLGFLTCTLNSTNQILHPCILVALFGNGDPCEDAAHDDGTITWNPAKEGTPLPRFYADGAANPLAGQLITAIAGGEMYFVSDAIERLLGPRGYDPITALHGGEPVGRRVMNWLGNSPHELGGRSGLTTRALEREFRSRFGRDSGDGGGEEDHVGNLTGLIRRQGMLAKFMSYGLSHNSRLNAVLSPCIVDESSKDSLDGTVRIKPNTSTRFFTDDTAHGLCIHLGLAELLGFDLERDMKQTLYVVRRLQRWMKKEFVLPADSVGRRGKIVGSARDVGETSAPQAFGIDSIQELRQFLKLDMFGEVLHPRAEAHLGRSRLVSRL